MAIWFHFSENGPDMDKKVTPYVNVHNLPYVLLYNYVILQFEKIEKMKEKIYNSIFQS